MTEGSRTVGPPELWRIFLAVDVGPAVREALAAVLRKWDRAGADVRWVRPELIHLTLIFLGDTSSAKVPQLMAITQEVAGRHAPFELEVRGHGWFGPPDRPRVLWAGISASPSLDRLHQDLTAALRAGGFQVEERPLVAHITLGRVRSPRGLMALTALLRSSTYNNEPWGRVQVREIHWMRSVLTTDGPVYSTVGTAALRES